MTEPGSGPTDPEWGPGRLQGEEWPAATGRGDSVGRRARTVNSQLCDSHRGRSPAACPKETPHSWHGLHVTGWAPGPSTAPAGPPVCSVPMQMARLTRALLPRGQRVFPQSSHIADNTWELNVWTGSTVSPARCFCDAPDPGPVPRAHCVPVCGRKSISAGGC